MEKDSSIKPRWQKYWDAFVEMMTDETITDSDKATWGTIKILDPTFPNNEATVCQIIKDQIENQKENEEASQKLKIMWEVLCCHEQNWWMDVYMPWAIEYRNLHPEVESGETSENLKQQTYLAQILFKERYANYILKNDCIEKCEALRKEVTQKKASELCMVSVSTIRNWDNGVHRPEGYPGRDNYLAFVMFSERYKSNKYVKSTCREMNRAQSMDPHDIEERADRSAFDDL